MSQSLEDRWQRIQAKLEAGRHLLESQGVVVRKRARRHLVWVLRYYEPQPVGRRIQRMVYLGQDEEVARRTERQLAEYREARRFAHETVVLAKIATGLGARVSALLNARSRRAMG